MGVNRKIFKTMFDRDKWKILRGDTVMITAGRDKGQTGVVQHVIRDKQFPRLVVEGRNLNKRFQKRTEQSPGGIISVESPLAYSNAMLVDPVTKRPVRVDWKYLEDGSRVRVTKGKLASQSIIARPEVLRERRTPRPPSGSKDTPEAEVNRVTYDPAAPFPFLREVPPPRTYPRRGYPSASSAPGAQPPWGSDSCGTGSGSGRGRQQQAPGWGLRGPLLGARQGCWERSGLSWRGSRGFAAQVLCSML